MLAEAFCWREQLSGYGLFSNIFQLKAFQKLILVYYLSLIFTG